MIKGMAIFNHKWYQAGMMIMNMNYTRSMLPFTQPITYCDLESDESFCIIIITIHFFPVEQAIDVNEKKIKPEFICFFFNYTVMKPFGSNILAAFMYKV